MHIAKHKNHVDLECRAAEVADIWASAALRPPEWVDGSDVNCIKNDEGYGDEFYGVFNEALAACTEGKFDSSEYMAAPFNSMFKDIGQRDAIKRKRRLDEHDGDFDLDRRWDIHCFYNTYREESRKRIHVDCDIAVSAGVDRKIIRRYGVLCFALIRRLEELGFVCDVSISCTTTKVLSPKGEDYDPYGDGRHGYNGKFWVKRAGEYQSLSSFAKYFTDWFYRRVVFCSMYYAAKETNMKAVSGLGYPNPPPFSAKAGFIQMSPGTFENVLRRGFKIDVKEIESAVKKAIAL